MAEILAAGAAIGIASSLVQFCRAAAEVLGRIREYRKQVDSVPEVVRHIDIQLDVLHATIL
jgi:hypothetical protein